jgi:hypothetical protein
LGAEQARVVWVQSFLQARQSHAAQLFRLGVAAFRAQDFGQFVARRKRPRIVAGGAPAFPDLARLFGSRQPWMSY